MKFTRISQAFSVIALASLALSLTYCGQQTGSSSGNANWGDGGQFDDIFGQGGGNPNNPSSPLGSGSGGGLSDDDKSALKAVFNEQGTVEPSQGAPLSDYLKQQAEAILKAEREGKDVAVQKMALASKILEECAKKVGKLGPIPGQPLMGLWQSSDAAACKTSFTVADSGTPGTYVVTGGTKGTMRATTVGDGVMSTKPYTEGRLTDRPQAGKGVLTHPEFTQTKYGYDPCSTNVALKTSANPIPKNYQEAMKQMGKCFRQASVLMSPIMDSMFKNMNPQLKALIQAKMLGLNVQ